MTLPYCLRAGLLLLGLSLVGCSGNSEIEISGKVTLDGAPVERGTIRFLADDGTGPSAEGVITAGDYKLRMLPGKKKVAILGYKKIGEHHIQGPDSPLIDDLEQVVPPQFNEQTTLVQEIDRSTKSPLNFDLKRM